LAASRNARDGKPSAADHSPLYPAWHVDRTGSAPGPASALQALAGSLQALAPADELALRALAAAYAAGVDRRDGEVLGAAFHEDATLTVEGRQGRRPLPSHTHTGREAIAGIVELLARNEATFHHLGQSRYERTGPGRATGEVYCEAHHLRIGLDGPDRPEVDRIMYIRYRDDYRHDPELGWRIAARVVQVDWTEDRPLGWTDRDREETAP